MTAEGHIGSGPYEEIQLLTFTIRGARLGVDTSQVSEMLEAEQAGERGLSVRRFDDALPFRGGPVTYTSPMVLLIKKGGPQYGILIDKPEEICPVPLSMIRPLPPFMLSRKGPKAIWGAVVREEEVILLVDFCRLT